MIYAEYWKTSRTSPEAWLEKAKREVVRAGGQVLAEGFGSDGDHAAFFSYLVLPDGRTAVELAVSELMGTFPSLLIEGV